MSTRTRELPDDKLYIALDAAEHLLAMIGTERQLEAIGALRAACVAARAPSDSVSEASEENRGILCWQGETGMWLAAHPWLDVITQGRTHAEARAAFHDALALLVMHSVGKDGRVALRVAPADVSEEWKRKAGECFEATRAEVLADPVARSAYEKNRDARASEAVTANDLRHAANELIDAIATPKGRDFRHAWEEACLLFGRFGSEPTLLAKLLALAEATRLYVADDDEDRVQTWDAVVDALDAALEALPTSSTAPEQRTKEASVCGASTTARSDEHETFTCTLTAGHTGAHLGGGCTWTDGDHHDAQRPNEAWPTSDEGSTHTRLTRIVDENLGYRETMTIDRLLAALEEELPLLRKNRNDLEELVLGLQRPETPSVDEFDKMLAWIRAYGEQPMVPAAADRHPLWVEGRFQESDALALVQLLEKHPWRSPPTGSGGAT